MTPFYHTLTELTLSPSTVQNSLPMPLAAPIKIEGSIASQLLKDELQNLEQPLTNTATDAVSQDIDLLTFDIGIDEVGRGPLYGSVVVSGAVLPKKWSAEIEQNPLQDTVLSTLTDSKKLTESKRERLFDPIKQHALAYIIVEIPAAIIDEVNILQATMLGMRVAGEQLMIAIVEALRSTVTETMEPSVRFNLLVDGNKLPDLDWSLLQHYGVGRFQGSRCSVYGEAWVKGDARHSAIAAASVLAKVSRDRQLIVDGAKYPGYGLEGHKGYPTKAHIEAIQQLGVLPQHRRSFKPIQQALQQHR
ncbi:ribonuclease HII [Psychrobacter phenylpyruvicus]|uniref:Ribonuclease n=1 Tax=Psychrobacter phenylpyruvicus TaxID=29432 RepID=A0A379LKG7_9GAMM|nr:ribonuclease HII [Psychrobacter phenylpyruvicus]SUD91110.1 Ribonuclease HII [Psychrobacter phenylpyruvicus]